MRRGLWSLVTLTTLLFCLVPSAARAADELGLSWDGHTWSGELSEPMFDPAARWVPGDVGAKSFYVRNQAESGANLTIAVVTLDDDDLLRYEDIRLSARVGAGEWVDLKRTEKNFRLTSEALPAGESRKVEVRANFDSASPNRSQRKQLTLKFRVTLSDVNAAPEDPDGPGDVDHEPTVPGETGGVDDESTGRLPTTGAPVIGWLIVFAGVAIGTGLALVTRSKREETEHGTAH